MNYENIKKLHKALKLFQDKYPNAIFEPIESWDRGIIRKAFVCGKPKDIEGDIHLIGWFAIGDKDKPGETNETFLMAESLFSKIVFNIFSEKIHEKSLNYLKIFA